jgi:hypothetical protein
MMNYEPMILDLVVDDFVGLWELLWRANTVAPTTDEAVRRQEVQKALTALLDRGAVSLYEGSSFTGEESLIPRERALRLVDQPSVWEPAGAAERHIRAAATGSGDEEYKRSHAR